MPALGDLLAPAALARLQAAAETPEPVKAANRNPRRRPMAPELPSYAVLEAERVANLERIAAEVAAAADAVPLDAPAKAAKAEPRETVGAIHRPRTKKRPSRLACTPAEQEAAEAKAQPKEITVPEQTNLRGSSHKINVSHLSDAELGRMVRAALLTLVVDELPAAMADVLGMRVEKAIDVVALRDDERAERASNPQYVLTGFVAGTLTVPTLDLRDVNLSEVAPSKRRSAYNRARYRLGTPEVMNAEATWQDLAVEHARLATLDVKPLTADEPATPAAAPATPATPKVAVVVVAKLDKDEKAKQVAALAEVLGISKKEAKAKLAELV